MEDAQLGTMSQFEADAHSFIVRLWREHSDMPDQPAEWRGRIDHVQSGQRRYFQDLAQISQIVSEFADESATIDNVFEPLPPSSPES